MPRKQDFCILGYRAISSVSSSDPLFPMASKRQTGDYTRGARAEMERCIPCPLLNGLGLSLALHHAFPALHIMIGLDRHCHGMGVGVFCVEGRSAGRSTTNPVINRESSSHERTNDGAG